MIKLIATDMDGTFLDSNKSFSKEFYELFFKLKEKNIRFCIASGNQYYRLYQKFIPMSNDMLFIAENGGYIADGVKEISSSVIDINTLNQLKDILSKEEEVFFILCGKKGAYIHEKHLNYINEVKKYYCMYRFVNNLDDIDDEILKIAIFDPHHQINITLKHLKDELPEGVKLVTSGNEWMDITNIETNKGTSMKLLQEIYHIHKDECAAFGDQMNDYEMLQEVKYAYAMNNATDKLKEISYKVIPSNDEQGVILQLKEILKGEY